jgi:hypothetical protein
MVFQFFKDIYIKIYSSTLENAKIFTLLCSFNASYEYTIHHHHTGQFNLGR